MTGSPRVVINGGGFGGLTLALALERYGIDYVLLDAKSSFALAHGGTIGLLPRGERILDQLGLADDILGTKDAIKEVTWVNDAATKRSGSTVYYMDHCITAEVIGQKLGYGFMFSRRQKMLKILYSHIKHKEKCLADKKVTRIEERGDKVVAFCGTEEFSGDILVGADGVRSITRREMWRIGNEKRPGTFNEKESTALKSEIQCLYGYSSPGDYGANYDRGCMHAAVEEGQGMLCFMGIDGYAQWCLYRHLNRTYEYQEMPRYSKEDAKEFAESVRHLPFNKNCSFSDVYDNVEFMHLTCLEEGGFKTYQHGRILLLGDAVHKTTPHGGIGANFAIEDAAVAANTIKRFFDGTVQSLTKYSDPERIKVIDEAYKDSYDSTRLMMDWGLPNKIMVRTLLRWAPDVLTQFGHQNLARASKLDFLPVPQRSVEGTMPFNPKGVSDNIYLRMFITLPLFYLHGQLDQRQDYVLYVIMLLEAARRINVVTFTALPNLILLVFGRWALPVWFWLHFVFAAPLRRYQSQTDRMMNVVHARAVLPVAVIGLYLGFQYAAALSLTITLLFKGTVGTDWRDRPFRDVVLVRATGLLISAVAVVDWWIGDRSWSTSTTGTLAWMGLIYADLFRLRHVQWWQLLVGAVLVPVIGPNAVVGFAWTYREELLRTSRDKNAITSVDHPHARMATDGNPLTNGGIHGTEKQNGNLQRENPQNGHAY